MEKKTNLDWIAVIRRWAGMITAIRKAGVQLPYTNYSIYGGGSYFTCSFDLGDLKFELKSDGAFNEEAYEAIENALNECRRNALEEVRTRMNDLQAEYERNEGIFDFLNVEE